MQSQLRCAAVGPTANHAPAVRVANEPYPADQRQRFGIAGALIGNVGPIHTILIDGFPRDANGLVLGWLFDSDGEQLDPARHIPTQVRHIPTQVCFPTQKPSPVSEYRTAWPDAGRSRRQLHEISSHSIGRRIAGQQLMLPRQVLPRQFYLITRRCTRRQFLLRPDAVTNNAFLYCMINAALRTEVDVLLPCAMSNHYHAVIYDRAGRYPEFIEHFHKLLARSQNALRGSWENFWSSEQTCVVKLIGREAVLDKLVYTATNPVMDDLVDRVHHWPGVNGLTALLAGRVIRATRPLHFFRPDGPMPNELEMLLSIPPELGPKQGVLAELRDRVHAVERERASERLRVGRHVLGRRAILAQSWRDQPASVEPRRNLRPRVATRSKWARIEALLRNRAFALDYATARERWQCGAPATFPIGTYWLQRFASVPVSEA